MRLSPQQTGRGESDIELSVLSAANQRYRAGGVAIDGRVVALSVKADLISRNVGEYSGRLQSLNRRDAGELRQVWTICKRLQAI